MTQPGTGNREVGLRATKRGGNETSIRPKWDPCKVSDVQYKAGSYGTWVHLVLPERSFHYLRYPIILAIILALSIPATANELTAGGEAERGGHFPTRQPQPCTTMLES